MSQDSLPDLIAEATSGKEWAFEPSSSSTAPTALHTIEEETSAAEEAFHTAAQMTALSPTPEENLQEQATREAAVSEAHSTEAQEAESIGVNETLSAEDQLREVYDRQTNAVALVEQNLIVDLPAPSLTYGQLHTASIPAVVPQPVTPESTSSSEPEVEDTAAQNTPRIVIPRRGNQRLPVGGETSFETGRMTVNRGDELNQRWQIPQRRQNENQRQPQASWQQADRPELHPRDLIGNQPSGPASRPLDHTPMIPDPRTTSFARPDQSAWLVPTTTAGFDTTTPTSWNIPQTGRIFPSFPRHLAAQPQPIALAPAPTERRIFPRYNHSVSPFIAAPLPIRPAPTASVLFNPSQPLASVTASSSSTTSAAPVTPADPEEAMRMGWKMVRLGDICPCNLDGHHCMLPVRCRYLKNKICTKKDCNCNEGKPKSEHKYHTKATCNSIREGRPCEFGGYGFCWFGHDAPGETARVDQARIHRAHHQGDV